MKKIYLCMISVLCMHLKGMDRASRQIVKVYPETEVPGCHLLDITFAKDCARLIMLMQDEQKNPVASTSSAAPANSMAASDFVKMVMPKLIQEQLNKYNCGKRSMANIIQADLFTRMNLAFKKLCPEASNNITQWNLVWLQGTEHIVASSPKEDQWENAISPHLTYRDNAISMDKRYLVLTLPVQDQDVVLHNDQLFIYHIENDKRSYYTEVKAQKAVVIDLAQWKAQYRYPSRKRRKKAV